MTIIKKDVSFLRSKISDFDAFVEKYKPLFTNGVLAGGFLRRAVHHGSFAAAFGNIREMARGDVDFFFSSVEASRVASYFISDKSLYPRLSAPNSITSAAYEVFDTETRVKFQFIVKNIGTPEKILNKFDITNCKIATDGNHMWVDSDWEELEAAKKIRIDNFAGMYLLSRLKKYLSKGFRLHEVNREEFLQRLLGMVSENQAGQVRSMIYQLRQNVINVEDLVLFYGKLGTCNYDHGSLFTGEDFAVHMLKELSSCNAS